MPGLLGPVAQRLEPAAHNGLVGGSSPSGPTNDLKGLRQLRSSRTLYPQRYHQRFARPRAVADGARGGLKVVGVMVAVDAIEHLDAHAEEAGSFPLVDARLHQ